MPQILKACMPQRSKIVKKYVNDNSERSKPEATSEPKTTVDALNTLKSVIKEYKKAKISATPLTEEKRAEYLTQIDEIIEDTVVKTNQLLPNIPFDIYRDLSGAVRDVAIDLNLHKLHRAIYG